MMGGLGGNVLTVSWGQQQHHASWLLRQNHRPFPSLQSLTLAKEVKGKMALKAHPGKLPLGNLCSRAALSLPNLEWHFTQTGFQ